MPINVFEGARRIAYLVGVLWAIGVVVVLFIAEEPRVEVTYTVFSPDLPPGRVDGRPSCESYDRREWDRRTTASGTNVAITICFRAQQFGDGKMLVPFRTEGDQIWGNEKYSTPVREYAERRMREFRMSEADQKWADDQFWPVRMERAWTAAKWIAGGWLALWIFTAAVGWIVRGFAGIPRGQDHRPGSK